MDIIDDVHDPQDSSESHADSSLCLADGAVQLDPNLLRWARLRAGSYITNEIFRAGKFYRRWGIRRLMYNVTQRLDYSPQAWLYLMVNSGRGGAGTARAHATVGVNRNPVVSVGARFAKRGGDADSPPVCTLLVYAVLGKRRFSRESICELVYCINAIKGLEGKVLEILRFAVCTDSPLRIDTSMFNPTSRWFMPLVQQYMTAHVHFIAYARGLARDVGASTPRPARRNTRPESPAATLLAPCPTPPPAAHDRPQMEAHPVPRVPPCSV